MQRGLGAHTVWSSRRALREGFTGQLVTEPIEPAWGRTQLLDPPAHTPLQDTAFLGGRGCS